MQTNIENFYRTVVQNPALLNKITTGANTPDEYIDRAVALAKDEGYAIDRTEAKTWIDSQIAARQNGELSDVQLEAVAGGKGASGGGGASMGRAPTGGTSAKGNISYAINTDVITPMNNAFVDAGKWFASW